MRALSTALLTLLCIRPAAAIDRTDPTGDYHADTTLSLMVAGNKAVAYYWGDDVGAAHRGCSCEYFFERRADGRWTSTTDPDISLKLDAKGFRIEDRWVHCCGSGVGAPAVQYADGRRDTCRVTGKTSPHLEPGTVVTAVTAPEWASFEASTPGEVDPRPQYLVRARVGETDQILLVPASELSCRSATPSALPTLAEAHASALALFKSGKAREAAQTLGKAAGPKPWNVSRDVLTVYNDWGFFLAESKQYPEAVEVLSAVVAAFPDRTPAYLNQGDAYVGLGDMASARSAYQRYADLMKKAGLERKIPDRVTLLLRQAGATEAPSRSLEQRAADATVDTSISLLVAESFRSPADAEAYVARLGRSGAIDLAKVFGPFGYEVVSARSFLAVARSEERLRTADALDPGRWINPYLCFAKEAPERARAAAKALGLVDRGFNELSWCNVVAWPEPVPREQLRALDRRVASAGFGEPVQVEIADLVIVLGKALTPAERSKLEGVARDHRIPVRALQSAYSEGD